MIRFFEWMIDKHFFLAVIVIVALAVGGVYLVLEVTGVNERNREAKAKCEQQGGHYFSARDARTICIKKESLISLK